MNIRTHSDAIDHPADRSVSCWLQTHGKRGVLGSALVLLLLVSCSQGDVRDERRFQAQEAKRTQQVPEAQQTELANTFMGPTGTPEATHTPIALLSELVISSGVDATGAPVDDLKFAPAGSQVFLAARLANLVGGEIITTEWLDTNGRVVASSEQQARASSGPQWYTASWTMSGVPGGTWAGAVRVNGQLLDSIVFQTG